MVKSVQKRVNFLLLTTSALAIGAGSARAQVVINPTTPFTNSGTINQLIFNDGAVHNGDVTNAGTGQISFSGQKGAVISLQNGTTLSNNFINAGTVSVKTTSTSNFFTGINTSGGTIKGSLINSGTVTVNGQSGAELGINLGSTGSATNSGTINVTGTLADNAVGIFFGTGVMALWL
jgi:hypothetical protein